MRRNAEYLVRKRGGRSEWLRATKLARSVEQALESSGDGEPWQALEIAETVIAGLQRRLAGMADPGDGSEPLTSDAIARAVERVLYATGFVAAAVRYAETRAERERRRQLLSIRVGGAVGPMVSTDRRLDGVLGQDPSRNCLPGN